MLIAFVGKWDRWAGGAVFNRFHNEGIPFRIADVKLHRMKEKEFENALHHLIAGGFIEVLESGKLRPSQNWKPKSPPTDVSSGR
ncbi:MAG: hypothetical protein HZB26_20605 [Candidatus Hydrogenedentes bacterium]|nr:hypothetical protein [Candidatus Hydrogenedentota bacterium]